MDNNITAKSYLPDKLKLNTLLSLSLYLIVIFAILIKYLSSLISSEGFSEIFCVLADDLIYLAIIISPFCLVYNIIIALSKNAKPIIRIFSLISALIIGFTIGDFLYCFISMILNPDPMLTNIINNK